MVKKHIFFITALLMCSASLFCAAKDNNERYQVIVENFSTETNKFNADFISDPVKDLEVVQEYKEKLEKEMTEYKKSWKPSITKGIGAGFGWHALLAAIYTIGLATNNGDTLWNIIEYALYPVLLIDIIMDILTIPILIPVHNQLTKNKALLLMASTQALASAGIAAYLLKKANSYKPEIERIEQEIATDTAIIEQLESMQQQN